jgi:ankyrin repeat protein
MLIAEKPGANRGTAGQPQRNLPLAEDRAGEDTSIRLGKQLLEDLRKISAVDVIAQVRKGADPNARDMSGCTLFMVASLWALGDHMKVLAGTGADVGARNSKDATALIIAACFGNHKGYDAVGVTKLILELARKQYGPDKAAFLEFVNAKNSERLSALECAKLGALECAEFRGSCARKAGELSASESVRLGENDAREKSFTEIAGILRANGAVG